MTKSSPSAAEKFLTMKFWIKSFMIVLILLILGALIFFNQEESNTYIVETLELSGSYNAGDTLFKMNCVGCHGITARGLVGPDLHSITHRLSDTEIIKQVTQGLTPPNAKF